MQVDTHRLVRFFDQKTFYTVHGDSALFIARQYYRTTAVIKYFGSVDTGLPGAPLCLVQICAAFTQYISCVVSLHDNDKMPDALHNMTSGLPSMARRSQLVQ